MSSKMHLMQMLIHTACTHTLLGWADPKDEQLDGLQDFAYWQHLARARWSAAASMACFLPTARLPTRFIKAAWCRRCNTAPPGPTTTQCRWWP